MNTRRQVGKNSANWNPNFANWIQLANVCQLENQKSAGVKSFVPITQGLKPYMGQ